MTPNGNGKKLSLLTLGALGVVFGDIGTSPLYAMQTVFAEHNGHRITPDPQGVFGIVSLIFWSVTLVVTIKYVMFITRADNDHEGGIMALIALVREKVQDKGKATVLLIALGLAGAALFYGDSMLTPAISVLSAVEGMEVVQPGLAKLVVPLTLVILGGLFAIQRLGTERVGKLFGPVMLIWFLVLGGLGLNMVLQHPGIIQGLNPWYAVDFFVAHKLLGVLALSAVVLTITGGEALYADMGHFGRPAIVRAWLIVAFPCLTLNYLGQSALILHAPNDISNPFFLLAPEALRTPLVILATVATVIASQAVISGAFSVTRQASQLGFLPRVMIRYTSEEAGQIYIPLVNWTLLAGVLTLVVLFRSSESLAGAYGIAVTACTAIDTILFFFVVRFLWEKPKGVAAAGLLFFGAIDAMFLIACLSKILAGGYIPVGIGIVIFILLTTWQKGRALLTERRGQKEGSLSSLVEEVNSANPPVARIKGTAVFMHPSDKTAPLALRANLQHNRLLHEETIILWIKTEQVPHVPWKDRLQVSDLGYADDGIFHITARFGFQDRPDIPRLLRQAQAQGLIEKMVDIDQASYFLSKMEIRSSSAPGMSRWRKRLFQAMNKISYDPVAYFRLPTDQAVVMGSHVDL